ncbi:cystathionine beta-synthase isoform X2 [Parasteatoda tepidariorum]|nr:cystathionine beta-synthase isoform X2 [Parasteatoda tepidariorum]XP_015905551.1 cystathionine beta-synthase isoform X2 [Parasteatoda tepidariorum]
MPKLNGFQSHEKNGFHSNGVNGFQSHEVNGSQSHQVNGFQNYETNGFQSPKVNGFQSPKVNGFSNPKMNGFQSSKMNGFQSPEMNGFQNSKLNGVPSQKSNGCPFRGELIPPDLPSKCTWRLNSKEKSAHHHCTFEPSRPKILPNVLHAIGNTPLIKLNIVPKEYGLKCDLLAKCEFFNPGGSIKDRIAVRMIEEAERENKISPEKSKIIEPTSGNTGIALALASVVKGYECTLVVPENKSQEKIDMLKALGANIVRTPAGKFDALDSPYNVAQKINEESDNSFLPYQYRCSSNPLTHYDWTAEEILAQCDNRLDMIVMGVGTGGTITGIGRKIKEKCPNCKVIGVDPYGSIIAEPASLNGPLVKGSDVEGIGHDFIPTALDRSVVDKWVKVNDNESLHMARSVIKKEGILCGGSSGSVVCAALKAAQELKEGQRCVVIMPDGARNYLTKFLSDNWMVEKQFMSADPEDSTIPWWWDQKVKSMKVSNVSSITPQTFCCDAIDIMNKKGCFQLPVIDTKGSMKGIVKLQDLTKKIVSGKVLSNSLVSEVTTTSFLKLNVDTTTLGRLSKILEAGQFAVLVENAGKTGAERLVGVVNQLDLVNFITTKCENGS